MIYIKIKFNDETVVVEKEGVTNCKDLIVALRKATYRLCGGSRKFEDKL